MSYIHPANPFYTEKERTNQPRNELIARVFFGLFVCVAVRFSFYIEIRKFHIRDRLILLWCIRLFNGYLHHHPKKKQMDGFTKADEKVILLKYISKCLFAIGSRFERQRFMYFDFQFSNVSSPFEKEEEEEKTNRKTTVPTKAQCTMDNLNH